MSPTGRNPRGPDYEELSLTRALTLMGRGIRLRCPHCGKGKLRATWLELKTRCPVCGLRTDRGEEDFFNGGMMWNIVFSEGSLILITVLVVIASWPDVHWTLIQWTGIVMMVIAPFLCYPFSLGFWLACDIMIRPVTEEELEWHRKSGERDFRSYVDR